MTDDLFNTPTEEVNRLVAEVHETKELLRDVSSKLSHIETRLKRVFPTAFPPKKGGDNWEKNAAGPGATYTHCGASDDSVPGTSRFGEERPDGRSPSQTIIIGRCGPVTSPPRVGGFAGKEKSLPENIDRGNPRPRQGKCYAFEAYEPRGTIKSV